MADDMKRFDRQFEAIARLVPFLRAPIKALRSDKYRLIRVPLALLFIAGGVFSFLPVLGVWMLPLGVLLLAVDLPFLRGPIAALIIRARRRISLWYRWWKTRRSQ